MSINAMTIPIAMVATGGMGDHSMEITSEVANEMGSDGAMPGLNTDDPVPTTTGDDNPSPATAGDDDPATAEDGNPTSGECSFTPSTNVQTNHGEQPISSLHVGERVLAYNPKTKKIEYEPILHIWAHLDDDLVDLTITIVSKNVGKPLSAKSEIIHTTSEHPFLTLEKGFLPVSKLYPGMHILREDGSFGVVTTSKVVHAQSVMYNLTVAQDHTFMVGSEQWIVHNTCTGGPPDDLPGANRDSPPTVIGFKNALKLADHALRHAGASTPAGWKVYEQQAIRFMSGPPGESVWQLMRPNGDIVRWDPSTGWFGIIDKDGGVLSYMNIGEEKADPEGYFRLQYR